MECKRVLGIEGTAWSLSAAIVGWDKVYAEVGDPYVPDKGGIHPMAAAQHHANHIGEVIKKYYHQESILTVSHFHRAPVSDPA